MKIGFIGGGNMGGAFINGLINAGFNPADIAVTDTSKEKLNEFSRVGVNCVSTAAEVEEVSGLVVFSVKPNIIDIVLKQMNGDVNKIYLSIAAGISISHLEDILGADKKIIRAMPNTPVQIGSGVIVVSPNKNVSDSEIESVKEIFGGVGDVSKIDEKHMAVATALHGSSPAYVYMMIDAMADAGVEYGLTKVQALKLVAKAVEGSAAMVSKTGIHPEQLKDNVCSPGGTTIAAVADLEKNGLRATMQSAIHACVDKANSMNK